MPDDLINSAISRARGIASRMTRNLRHAPQMGEVALQSAQYWTEHNVTAHLRFASAAESLEYFHWRNAQYQNYIDLMPVSGCDDMVVLDLGCGPGNDLVGFGTFSRPRRLLGADVSPIALSEARERIRLHGIEAELTQLPQNSAILPYEVGSIDYLHSSGVLHHVPDLTASFNECRRILRPSGEMRVMVYNYDSVWLHLYVAYVKQIAENLYTDWDIAAAFARTTDGPDCPISRAYTPKAFARQAEECGFRCEFLGAGISMWEMSLLHRRYEAVMDRRLAREHRDFLLELDLDKKGYPVYRGQFAGIDACFSLRPR